MRSASQKPTEGLKNITAKHGLLGRAMRGMRSGAEALNLKYSAVGNPPVYPTEMFPWAREIEAEWHLIRAELDRVLVRKDDLPAFHEIASDVGSISSDRNWKTYFLCSYGIRAEEAIRQCPETWRLLQKIPNLKSAMFSIFEPGKHLRPHRGPYNGVLRFHLGLVVPDEPDRIGIRIAGETRAWREGEALIFDDAYEHEAWNHSDGVRVVLFCDFEKPTRFPASVTNKALLNLAPFTPFVREGYKAQKRWEKLFYGEATGER